MAESARNKSKSGRKMRLQWRRFKWAALVSLFIGMAGFFLLIFGIISGRTTGTLLAVLGGVAIAGAGFDFYRMYGY